MTYTEDFISNEPDQEFLDEPGYPSAFGITFTPRIGGIIFAVLGLLGAGYLMISQVLPTFQNNQDLQKKIEDTQEQIKQKQNSQQKINLAQENLDAAKLKKKDVLALFANEKTMDTLLLDINRFINARQGKLLSFVPEQQGAVVNDGSLGIDLNNKLKRQNVAIQLEGSFDQIQSIMRSIERLQTLLLVQDFQVQVGGQNPQKLVVNKQGQAVAIGPATLQTSFKLQLLKPLTPEETAALAPPPPAKK
ncbi:MAG: hypothetical protein NVS2B14_15510 [Chamaesiphon sp.]